jgi:uncharacterized membrane protein YecN with MAPEG domain
MGEYLKMILATTLSAAASAAVINIWLSVRCGQVRTAEKILMGDGGNDRLIRRMRAQANFIENTPLVLMLIAALELARGGSTWLAAVSAVYMLGRVLHGLGMDGGAMAKGRMIGTIITLLTQLGLAIWAIATALGH